MERQLNGGVSLQTLSSSLCAPVINLKSKNYQTNPFLKPEKPPKQREITTFRAMPAQKRTHFYCPPIRSERTQSNPVEPKMQAYSLNSQLPTLNSFGHSNPFQAIQGGMPPPRSRPWTLELWTVDRGRTFSPIEPSRAQSCLVVEGGIDARKLKTRNPKLETSLH